MDLAERLKPYVDVGPPAEPMVDADPIRMFLIRWMIETGDPIEVVSKGFGLDRELLEEVANKTVQHLSAAEADRLWECLGMRLPEE